MMTFRTACRGVGGWVNDEGYVRIGKRVWVMMWDRVINDGWGRSRRVNEGVIKAEKENYKKPSERIPITGQIIDVGFYLRHQKKQRASEGGAVPRGKEVPVIPPG